MEFSAQQIAMLLGGKSRATAIAKFGMLAL